MNNSENYSTPPFTSRPARFSRTVWVKFLRIIAWIGFWLIIAAGALFCIAVVLTAGPVGILLGLLEVGLCVLLAFLLCSRTFIKLDMADDIHKIREMLEKR